jgi:hypothetical protein
MMLKPVTLKSTLFQVQIYITSSYDVTPENRLNIRLMKRSLVATKEERTGVCAKVSRGRTDENQPLLGLVHAVQTALHLLHQRFGGDFGEIHLGERSTSLTGARRKTCDKKEQ